MSKETLGNYLTDLGFLLKEAALEAKAGAARETGEPGYQYALGRAMAYYEVLSLMQQQAKAFGVDAKDLSLHDFDPDRLEELERRGIDSVTGEVPPGFADERWYAREVKRSN